MIVGSETHAYFSQIRTNARIFQAQDPGLSREQAEKLVREKMWERFEITTRPVDKRENYIKRGVGMPGDILELKGAQLYVNGKMSDNPENLQYRYEVRTNGAPLNRMKLQDIGLSLEDIGIPSTVNYFPLT